MGSSAIHFEVVGAEVTRLKFPFDQSLPTSAPTSLVTRILGVWGGAATPPYRMMVVPLSGMRSAVTFCGQAQRWSQPATQGRTALSACLGVGERSRASGRAGATRSGSSSRMPEPASPMALPTTRQRPGVRCRVQRQHRFRVRSIVPSGLELRTPHKAALHAALQDTGAHSVSFGNCRNRHAARALCETGCKPVLPS